MEEGQFALIYTSEGLPWNQFPAITTVPLTVTNFTRGRGTHQCKLTIPDFMGGRINKLVNAINAIYFEVLVIVSLF